MRKTATAVLGLAVVLGLLAAPATATSPGANGPILLNRTDALGVTIVGVDGSLTELNTEEPIHMEVSPDGREVLYAGYGGTGGVFLQSLAGGPVIEVVARPIGGRPDVSWSPDGSRFVVAIGNEVTTYARDGSDPQVVLDVAADPSVNNSVDSVVWTAANEIMVFNFGSTARINMTTGATDYPFFRSDIYYIDDQFGLDASPDGQQLTMSCGERAAGFPNGVCLFDRDFQFTRFLPPSTVPGSTRLMQPAWSPDGTRLAFIALFDNEVAQVWTAAVDGTDAQFVADLPADPQFQGNFPGLQSWARVPDTPPVPLEEPPPPPTNAALLDGGFDDNPATTERADFTDPTLYAVAVSQARFAAGAADRVVLSRDDNFADSLVGTALTGSGPLLFTATDELPGATATEIGRVLADGDTVYLLGGPVAISAEVEAQLAADYTVERLSGPSRVETSVAVADEVIAQGGDTDTVVIARAGGPADNPTAAWADSVAVGAWTARDQVPTVVTDTASVHPAVADWLDVVDPTRTVLLGGPAALSAEVEAAVPSPERVFGASRAGTAAAIAAELVAPGLADDAPRRIVAVNGFRADGWLFGLPAGGLAADAGASLALVQDPLPPETAGQACDPAAVDVLLAGGLGVIGEEVESQLDAAGAC